jgi:hypothetical protein
MAHPTELPRPPNGNSSEASWFTKLLRCVRERSFIAGSGIRLEHKTNGTVISATADGGVASGTQMRWRGEWTAGTPTDELGPYKEGDLVIRGSANPASVSVNATDTILGDGKKAGLYIAIADIDPATTEPVEPPGDSVNWETFARGSWHLLVVTPSTGGGTITLDSRNPSASAVAALSALNGHDVAFREYAVCVTVNGVKTEKKAMLWGSLPYD